MILLIDNYDSFVFNLARYVRELGEETVARRDVVRGNRDVAPVPHHHLTGPVLAGGGGDLHGRRAAVRADDPDPGRLPGASMHWRRVRGRHRARRATGARQGGADPARRARLVRGTPQPLPGGALSLARHRPRGSARRPPGHRDRGRRGDHGRRARAPSRDRCAIPPRVRAHGARLRAAGPVPARGCLLPRHAPRPRRWRTLGRPEGARAVIIESILTTMDARGAVNFAPMGVEWGEDEIVIKPFLETTTFRN